MQHIVERDDAVRMQHRMREFEVGREARVFVLAVDVEETHRGERSLRAQLAGVILPLCAFQAVKRSAESPARAQCCQKRGSTPSFGQSNRSMPTACSPGAKPERQRDEEAALERADLGDVARDALLALPAHDMAADRRGKARRHAAHARVLRLQIGVDGGVSARRWQQSELLCRPVPCVSCGGNLYRARRSDGLPATNHEKATMLARLAFCIFMLAAALPRPAAAQQELKIGIGFGVGFLPFYVIDEKKLVEKHAKAAGLDVKASFVKISGSGPMQDAILSGAIDMGAYGTSPLLIAWEKARGTPQQIFAISGVTTVPMVLLTNKPNVKKLADFTPQDRIAMPSIVSPQMFILQMQSVKEFGEGQHDKVKPLIVSLPHPESDECAVLRQRSDGLFRAAAVHPGGAQESKVSVVMSSADVLGGKSSFLVIGANKGWIDRNPKCRK